MLDIKDLKLAYENKPVLNGMNMHLSSGESLAIIGPSGCGKSTLLCIIAGLLSHYEGEILIDNKPISEMQRSVGLALQDNNLFPWLTVYKNLSLGLKARGYKKGEIKEKIEALAKELRITHLLKRYPLSLSGGERQRVAIGCILVWQPKLLLLDEPSSALDAFHKERFQDFILDIKKQYPMTLVFVTHSIEEAIVLGEKIMIMGTNGTYRIYENELYGMENIRESMTFYKKCLEIRGYLRKQEVGHEK